MKFLSNTIFLITALLLSPVLCTVAGNNAYGLTSKPYDTQRSVYTYGFKEGKDPVVRANIDLRDRIIVVKDAWNAKDTTRSPLHLDEILRWMWTNEGGRLSDLRSIEFHKVVNPQTEDAILKIRKRRGLARDASFMVTEPGVSGSAEGASDKDWNSLFESPLGKAARRVAAAGGQNVDRFEIMSETWISGKKLRYFEYLTVKLK